MAFRTNKCSPSLFSERYLRASPKPNQDIPITQQSSNPHQPLQIQADIKKANSLFFEAINDSTNYLSNLLTNTRDTKSIKNKEKQNLLLSLSNDLNSLKLVKKIN